MESDMIRVTVAQTSLREIPYTDKKGNAQRLLVQNAYAHTVDENGDGPAYPEKFEIVLPKGKSEPYAKGDYTLHPSALYVDQKGRLSVSPRLTPLKKPGA